MQIRPANPTDFPAMWRIFAAVVAREDTYVFSARAGEEEARAYWFGAGVASDVTSDVASFVAEEDGQIVGMYKLVANQLDLGDHVANASFMVDARCAGRGIGRLLGMHCLEQARAAGYLAMQFNFVVSTNTAAVRLWQSLGFAIVGTLPKVFRHRELGLVDAFVMHRFL